MKNHLGTVRAYVSSRTSVSWPKRLPVSRSGRYAQVAHVAGRQRSGIRRSDSPSIFYPQEPSSSRQLYRPRSFEGKVQHRGGGTSILGVRGDSANACYIRRLRQPRDQVLLDALRFVTCPQEVGAQELAGHLWQALMLTMLPIQSIILNLLNLLPMKRRERPRWEESRASFSEVGPGQGEDTTVRILGSSQKRHSLTVSTDPSGVQVQALLRNSAFPHHRLPIAQRSGLGSLPRKFTEIDHHWLQTQGPPSKMSLSPEEPLESIVMLKRTAHQSSSLMPPSPATSITHGGA